MAVADRDLAGEDQRLEARAREFGAGGEQAVEPLAGFITGNHQFSAPLHGRMLHMRAVSEDDERPLDPAAARIVAKVRWLMLISGFATVLGIAVVIGVIGYRFSRSEGSVADMTAMLPKGARIVSTTIAGDRIAVTVEAAGAFEIHTFDLHTLKPRGRLRFATEP